MIRYRTADYFITPEDWQDWWAMRDEAYELNHTLEQERQESEAQQAKENHAPHRTDGRK